MSCSLPGDFEHSEKTNTAKYTNTEWDFNVVLENYFTDTAEYDEAVEAIEHGKKITAHAQRIHFQEHLEGKQDDEKYVHEHLQKNRW